MFYTNYLIIIIMFYTQYEVIFQIWGSKPTKTSFKQGYLAVPICLLGIEHQDHAEHMCVLRAARPAICINVDKKRSDFIYSFCNARARKFPCRAILPLV